MDQDNPECWRSVIDQKSGRTYWYHRVTRATTWSKPKCLQDIDEFIGKPSESKTNITSRHTENDVVSDNIHHKSPVTLLIAAMLHQDENVAGRAMHFLSSQLDNLLSISSTLVQHPSIINSLVNCLLRLQSPSVMVMGFKLLWTLSLSIVSIPAFYADRSWINLADISINSRNTECIIYYMLFQSNIMLSKTKALLDDDTLHSFSDLFEDLLPANEFDANERIFSQFEKDGILSPYHSLSMQLLSDSVINGNIIPGLLMVSFFQYLIKTRDRLKDNEILIRWVLPTSFRALSSNSTDSFIKESLKQAFQQAMNVSQYIRYQVLNLYIDLSTSISCLGYPLQYVDPRKCILDDNILASINLSSYYDDNDVEDHVDLAILRDIEWKPVDGCPWSLCSTVMYSRCPGLRDVIIEFWNAGGGVLELNIDSSEESLCSTCHYIHNGVYSPPARYVHKLELLKISIELDMNLLTEHAIVDVQHNLTEEFLGITTEFCVTHKVETLLEYCMQYERNHSASNLKFELGIVPSSKSLEEPRYHIDDNNLSVSIEESLREVRDIEIQSGRKKLVIDKLPEPVFIPVVNIATTCKDAQPRMKAKSGGIYGLILGTMDGAGDAIDTSSSVDAHLQKVHNHENVIRNSQQGQHVSKSHENQILNPKHAKTINKPQLNDQKQKSKKTMSNAIQQDDLSIVEFDSTMSLQPEAVIPTHEKRSHAGRAPKKGDSLTARVDAPKISFQYNSDNAAEDEGPQHQIRSSLSLLKRKSSIRSIKVASNLPAESSSIPEALETGSMLDTDSSHATITTSKLSDSISGAQQPSVSLSQCINCGRRFNTTSLQVHEKICAKVFSRKREVFDSSKQREIKDDDDATSSAVKSKPKNDESMKTRKLAPGARNSTDSVKGSKPPVYGKASTIPSDGLFECPNCIRRFNKKAADRHFPICSSIIAKPKLLRKGSNTRTI